MRRGCEAFSDTFSRTGAKRDHPSRMERLKRPILFVPAEDEQQDGEHPDAAEAEDEQAPEGPASPGRREAERERYGSASPGRGDEEPEHCGAGSPKRREDEAGPGAEGGGED